MFYTWTLTFTFNLPFLPLIPARPNERQPALALHHWAPICLTIHHLRCTQPAFKKKIICIWNFVMAVAMIMMMMVVIMIQTFDRWWWGASTLLGRNPHQLRHPLNKDDDKMTMHKCTKSKFTKCCHWQMSRLSGCYISRERFLAKMAGVWRHLRSLFTLTHLLSC